MTTEQSGQCALVTGASRGIGRAIALRLGAAGHHVFVNYARDVAGAEDTCAAIVSRGGSASSLRFDVGQTDAIEAGFEAIDEQGHGPLAVLINNAGVSDDQLILELESARIDDLMAVNVRGSLICAKLALSRMLRKRWGRVVNISSVMAEQPNRGVAAYAASKGAINALTRALALEVGHRGITVNAVAPGFIATAMTHDYGVEIDMRRVNAARRIGTADEVAAVVGFLASPDATFVNGQVLRVDGGPSSYLETIS